MWRPDPEVEKLCLTCKDGQNPPTRAQEVCVRARACVWHRFFCQFFACWGSEWLSELLSRSLSVCVAAGAPCVCAGVWADVCYDRTSSVTVPLCFFRMATACSCVAPCRLSPFTARIWSPRFRRPSAAAAPWNQPTRSTFTFPVPRSTWHHQTETGPDLVEDGLHVDRQVSVRTAEATDDAEAEPLWTFF